MTVLTPAGLVAARADMVRWLRNERTGARWLWPRLGRDEFPPTPLTDGVPWPDAALRLAHRAAVFTEATDLFLVDADMTRMAMGAGAQLPDYRLHPEDVPAESGLVAWQTPVGEVNENTYGAGIPVLAATWAPHPGGLWVTWWTDCYRLAEASTTAGRLGDNEAAELRAAGRLVHERETILPFAEAPGFVTVSGDIVWPGMIRTLIATWLLMGQTIAAIGTASLSRQDERRLRRRDVDPSPVRTVSLRRPAKAAAGDGQPAGNGRAYRHRWIVAGHWRNQWYPSRQDHRPIWVSDYVKGPEGAPVLERDVVRVLRR